MRSTSGRARPPLVSKQRDITLAKIIYFFLQPPGDNADEQDSGATSGPLSPTVGV